MPSRTLATLSVLAAAVLAPAGVADAAAKYPTVKKIAPMTVSVGETMTVTGSGFVKGKGKNTVVFRRAGERSIFVKADGLSSTRLNVVVPEKLRSSLATKSGKAVSTKFQIRILAKRFGRGYTPLTKSPTVRAAATKAGTTTTETTPAATTTTAAAPTGRTDAPAPAPAPVPEPNCDGDSQVDAVDADDDNDLLADTTEDTLQTNRCLSDTDGDGMQDGWEYQSAIDLNQPSCPKAPANADPSFDYPRPCSAVLPYPGKRNYPNPLTADPNEDWDGDWLPGWAEHRAWQKKGASDATYRALTGPKGMWYSNGKKASVDNAPEPNTCVGMAVPALPFDGNFSRPQFEIGEGTGTYPNPFQVDGVTLKEEYEIYRLSRGGDECLDDAERDEDGDFLSNHDELTGPLSGQSWWSTATQEPIFRLAYAGTDWLDADSDGDQTVDALDDQDFDDFLNIEEIERGAKLWTDKREYPQIPPHVASDARIYGLWVDPFNPCLPSTESRTCPNGRPVGAPGAWRPYFADSEKPGKPRWPLYGTALYAGIEYPDPSWVDDGNPATLPNEAPMLAGPVERWTGMPAVDQTMPPLHPLPRPLP